MTKDRDPIVFRVAGAADVGFLPGIELAAGEAFRAIGMDEVADDDPPKTEELARYQRDGRCWVAEFDGVVIGYLIAQEIDGGAHIEQVSVHREFGGAGIGRRLMEIAEQWAVDRGHAAMTLTTFVEVPWNGPYYRRLGYHDIDRSELTPDLKAIRNAEAAAGLDRWPRVAMRKHLPLDGPEVGGR